MVTGKKFLLDQQCKPVTVFVSFKSREMDWDYLICICLSAKQNSTFDASPVH